MNVAAVIMAGGRGERFWPSSREDYPKQFLAFDGDQTLLQRTIHRLHGICPMEDTWVVTRRDYAEIVQEQLVGLPIAQILREPQGRDTAPCIALAAAYLGRFAPDAVMVVLPADHLILQEDRFRDVLRSAVRLAEHGEHLITLGVRPTRPETGYGYIRMGERYDGDAQRIAHHVSAFTEKPPRDTALAYLQSGQYLWNSGIFVWKVSAIKSALSQYLPTLVEALKPLEAAIGTEHEGRMLQEIYPTLPKISIDYAVMEQASNTLVIPADIGWDDLGTWSALERVVPPDTDGNIITGHVLAVDTRSSILQGRQDGRLLVTYGLSDVVVVETEDVVLVADKGRTSDLKAVVGRLEAEGLKRHLRSPAFQSTPLGGKP